MGGEDKYGLLGRAAALVFPLQWEEPFGMVLVEAMACGTPVLSLSRGAVPELVVDGLTGFVRQEVGELVPCLQMLNQIQPRECRRHVERSFSPAAMVSGYEQVYRECLRSQSAPELSIPRLELPRGQITKPTLGQLDHPDVPQLTKD